MTLHKPETWWIECDRSEEDGITCCQVGGPSPTDAEHMAATNGWISGDGYHECPRHRRSAA